MTETLQCLKKYGQRLDVELASEMGIPLAAVRKSLVALTNSQQAIVCQVMKFENGKKIDVWQCRVSGYVPPAAPGRKAKPKAAA